jgi:hypothetical protein
MRRDKRLNLNADQVQHTQASNVAFLAGWDALAITWS